MISLEHGFGINQQTFTKRQARSGESVVLVCITKSNNPKKLYLTLLAKAALPIGSATQKEECQK